MSVACVEEVTSLTSILESLTEQPRTGRLSVRYGGGRFKLTADVVRGQVASVTTNDPAFQLGRFLLRAGAVGSRRQRLLDGFTSRTSVPQEEVLFAADVVQEPVLHAIRTFHATEALLGLDLFRDLETHFDEHGSGDRTAPDLDLNPTTLLEQSTCRADCAASLRERYGTGVQVAHRLGRPVGPISHGEDLVLSILDESMRVADLVVESGLGRWRTLEALDALCEAGALQLDLEDEGSSLLGGHNETLCNPATSSFAPDPELSDAFIVVGRHLMEQRSYQSSVEAFRSAVVACPDHPLAATILAGAEETYCNVIYGSEFPANKKLTVNLDSAGPRTRPLSPMEAFLLTRAAEEPDVRTTVATAPMKELEALMTLRQLKTDGYLRVI